MTSLFCKGRRFNTDTIVVARNILDGIEKGEEYIFPDPMAQQVGPLFLNSPKALEQNFASF